MRRSQPSDKGRHPLFLAYQRGRVFATLAPNSTDCTPLRVVYPEPVTFRVARSSEPTRGTILSAYEHQLRGGGPIRTIPFGRDALGTGMHRRGISLRAISPRFDSTMADAPLRKLMSSSRIGIW